jgi:hypothetical protein
MGMAPTVRWGFSPMPARPPNPILRLMIRAADEYWDSDRASYEDELNAWRERTAAAVAAAVVAPAPAARRQIWPKLRPGNVSGDRTRLAKRSGTHRVAVHAQAARRARAETRRTGIRPPLTF